jgi:uncharacterized protein
VYKVQGLAAKMMAGQREALRQRFAMIDYLRSVLRAVIIDSKEEEFERQPLQLAGVHEILNQAAFRVSATAEVPTMVLFGQDPSGLNASGTASLRWWQDKMASRQENDLAGKIKIFAKNILTVQGKPQLVPKLEVKFEPLYTLTALEEAQAFTAQATGCKTLVDAQIFTPEEVAISKVQNGEWVSAWSGVRNEERKAMLDDVIANLVAGTEPGAPPVVNGRVGQEPPDPVELAAAQAGAARDMQE